MSSEIQEILAPYPVITTLPVQWGDMDSARHVNNVIYLRWAESGRLDYFEHLGLLDFSGDRVGAILGAIQCKYIFPLTYPDTVLVGTRTKEIKTDRFILESVVVSKTHERLAAWIIADIVPYDYQKLKKAGMPEEMRTKIAELEAGNVRSS